MSLFVIAVGGSLIIPEEIDKKFLAEFRNLILRQIKKGHKFILVTGGGKIARNYRDALKDINKNATNEDKDWLGIYCTHLNAHLLHSIFKGKVHPKIFTKETDEIKETSHSILVGGGISPGRSSDYPSCFLAKRYGADTIINLSNISYVYEKDPKIHPNAKKFESIKWEDYIKLIGDTWTPGMSAPFDPTASKYAKQNGLKVVLIKGSNLSSLEEFLETKKCSGTIIS